MFYKIAKYFDKRQNYHLALSSLLEAEKYQNIRHKDFNVLTSKAKVFLNLGSYNQALRLSEQILRLPGNNLLKG